MLLYFYLVSPSRHAACTQHDASLTAVLVVAVAGAQVKPCQPAQVLRRICHRRRDHALDFDVVVDCGRTGQPAGKAAHNPCATPHLPGVLHACFDYPSLSVLRVVRPQAHVPPRLSLLLIGIDVHEAIAALQTSPVCKVTLFTTASSS